MKRNFLLLVFLIGIVASASAQKVKYKDLFILLNARNYSDGERYLRIVLAEEPDHPNGNYHMACMLQGQLESLNILTQTEDYTKIADSSIYFYEKSLALITDKEIKKHDKDYYAAYKRRDMRSGKFQVKLSDVQLDLEKRMSQVKKNKENGLMLSALVSEAERLYAICQDEFVDINSQYESYSELQIMADEVLVERLISLMSVYDSSYNSMSHYAEIIKNETLLTTEELSDFKTNGRSEADFYGESIVYWDYKTWAGNTIKVINNEIVPLKQELISYDKKINELYLSLLEDSTDVRSEVFDLATASVSRDLRAYDTEALPLTLFNLRIAEINYLSTYYQWLNVVYDSADVGLKIVVLADLLNQITAMETLFDELSAHDHEKTQIKYNMFIDARYQSYDELMHFFAAKQPLLAEQKVYIEKESTKALEADKWGIWENDSIPLIAGEQHARSDSSVTYSTSFVEIIDTRSVAVYGFRQEGKENDIYTAIVPSSRHLEDIKLIPLDAIFGDHDMSKIDYLDRMVETGGRIWVVSVPNNGSSQKFTTQVVMLTAESDLKWSNKFTLAELPVSIDFDQSNNFHSVKGNSESILLKLDEFGENRMELSPEANNADFLKSAIKTGQPADTTSENYQNEGTN